MTSNVDSTPVPASQPFFPAFIICDRVPEGCKAYPVFDNRTAPLIRAGEWVIIDPEDRDPVEGELFVIDWRSGNSRPMVVECQWNEKYTLWAVG